MSTPEASITDLLKQLMEAQEKTQKWTVQNCRQLSGCHNGRSANPKPVDDKAAKALANMEEELRKGWAKIADWQKKNKIADTVWRETLALRKFGEIDD